MKITIVLGPQWPLPPTGFGAVEKVWLELAEDFSARGHELCVIGRGGAGPGERRLPSGVYIRERRGFSASGSLWWDLCRDFLYALNVLPAIPRSDIVVTNCFSLPVVLAPIRRWKGRVVVHVARFPKGQMGLYRGADSVQAISGAVAGAIVAQCRALTDKVTVVGYPVNIDQYTPPSTGRQMPRDALILFVGRVHREKGVHLLIEAFRLLSGRAPNVRLKIVGPIEEARGGGGSVYLQQLTSAAAGLPVEFAPAVSNPRELAETYRHADCFCYPSLAETGEAFGLAVLEAMATGLPCVVSKLECFSDFIVDGVDALTFDHRCAEPAQALSNALYALVTEPARSDEMSRRARVRAEQFSIGKVSEAYLKLFSTLVSAPMASSTFR